ncbi:hypothetical protein [Desulfotalea psychrophila]|uniref:Uncharacterized protein n=1 Tax=Desulfotalea psychrophila (strain LSv54 / DSM 12343) TaxID=177439 RepID=Q6AR80_DESPS|nr:hypothetical protein [Desulfotalea psychrophila]CAG35144.1 unknown protein [Desulfotalea psychrophila LSv54]
MKLLFWIGIVFTLVVPPIIGVYFGDQSTSWAAALCGAFVTFVSRLSELAELSLGPVKAKMKEKVDEASATIEQLRNVAVANSEATLTDLIAGNFIDGMSQAKRLQIHDNIICALRQIGATDAQIENAEKDWKKGITVIYHRIIRRVVMGREQASVINSKTTENQNAAASEMQDLLDFDNWMAPSPHQIEMILKKYSVRSSEINFWVSDYKHFLECNEIRHGDQFVKE